MRIGKRIIKHPHTQSTLAFLLSLYIRLVFLTSRLEKNIHPEAQDYLQGKTNAIFAFWHGRMMLLPAFCPPGRIMRVLISLHRDGILISRVISHFGQATVGGSTSKGGLSAVKEILSALNAGDNISITPDGPRGPNQTASRGVATLARLSGKPILPVTFASSKYKRFHSWDRFMLALPFGYIRFCIGAPLFIDPKTDEETGRIHIETAMNQLTEMADAAAAC